MTAMTSAAVTASATATTTATSAASAASAGTASAAATISTTITAVAAIASVRGAFAVEVRLIWFVGEIAAAFDDQRAALNWLASLCCRGRRVFSSSALRGHLGSLLFQDGFARESDAVAFHCQDLHEDLIAFLQFVANIGNSVLSDFADVEQAFGSRDDFDECAEIGEARDFSEVGLAHFGGGGDVSNDLQSFRR